MWHSGKESTYQCSICKRREFNPWVRKTPWSRKWQPTPVSCLENSTDRGTWQATVHGVTKSRTPLSTYAPLTWAPNNIQPTQASEHIYMTVVISSKISSVVTATSHSNDPAPNGQKPQSGSLGRVPHRHLRGRWEDFLKDFLITMAKIKQLLIYTPCLTVFSMTFLWSWKLYKCSQWLIKTMAEDFPGETVDKTLPANAGDMGWPLIQEDSTCLRTAQPVYHNYWNWALKSRSHNYWAYVPQQLKSPHPRANAPQ